MENLDDRSPQHEAVLALAISHFNLLDSAEQDMDGQPVLTQIYEDYESAALWLIGALQRSLR